MKPLQLLTLSIALTVASTHQAASQDTANTLHFDSRDYVPSGSFCNNDTVEEIVFDGLLGHIDGYQVRNCPRLKRIVFNGPIFSTGGYEMANNCPMLTEVEVNGLALNYHLFEFPDCDSFKGIKVSGAIINSDDTVYIHTVTPADIKSNPDMVAQVEQLARWQMKAMKEKGWLKKMASMNKNGIIDLAGGVGLADICDSIEANYQAYRDPDEGKTYLQILKESPVYTCTDNDTTRLFTYTPATDSLLTLTRQYFNIDSIAGDGNDISRIKNLLYWIHDLVRHDGSSSWPDCHFNLRELTQVSREQQRGYNCRFMAMMLTEALLSAGIPARYVTCQSKLWDEDNDCHVICVAWSDSLGKWIWVDPTFAAYVTDENGLLLHPGEVRYRLQHDMPLVLNDDANWNHESEATKEYYLEHYMAKNLYIMSANSLQQSEPEGKAEHPQGYHIGLTPVDSNYTNSRMIITDEKLFWQPPY